MQTKRICSGCGCTDDNACKSSMPGIDACWWAGLNVCSECRPIATDFSRADQKQHLREMNEQLFAITLGWAMPAPAKTEMT